VGARFHRLFPRADGSCELCEFFHDLFVDLALERHHEVGDVAQRFPAPSGKFRFVRAVRMDDIDLAVLSGEAQREPLLRLTAIPALPCLANDIAGNVIVEPLCDFTEAFDRADVCLLAEFAKRRAPRILAWIDAALRHLPRMRGIHVLWPIDASADEGMAAAIEHHDADAGPKGEIFKSHDEEGRTMMSEWQKVAPFYSEPCYFAIRCFRIQVCFGFAAIAVIGTINSPRLAASFAHLAM
jgi:hypothetical protein